MTLGPVASEFLARQGFVPDPFQVDAIAAIERGETVVVTAPTGSGKTLIAAAAVHLALSRGHRAFYTTPIKALSNQKFTEFRQSYGLDRVGLLTGDNVINPDAPVVVMTTEVLRNMIYEESSALDDLGVVVLDEVHYLQDRYRGAVWEEVIIHLPRRVQLVNLSATIANPEEFSDWIASRRGETTLIVERHRPVPLESLYMVKDRHHEGEILLTPIFDRTGRRPNPQVAKLLKKGRGRFRRFATPRRLEVVERMRAEGLLPAIYFIFSRAGCDQAAAALAASVGFTTEDQRLEIRRIAETRTRHIPSDDLAVLGYDGWVAKLERGVAAHHAGMVPAFKETVEELFAVGLVDVVFATETLALGINMPARSVVLESLSKFTGEHHELLRPGDYTQLTGRAGRRGIDEEGTAVVLHSPYVPFDKVADIAATGAHRLVSSFQPTYNMAVNLVANYSKERAEELLAASFARFHAQRRQASILARIEERREEYEALMAASRCERGDLDEYLASGPEPIDVERRLIDFVTDLHPGDVIQRGDGHRWALLARGYGPKPRLSMVSDEGEGRRFRIEDLGWEVARLGSIDLPRPIRPRDSGYRNSIGKRLREWEPEGPARPALEPDVERGPVASCPDLAEHLRWRRKADKVRRDLRRLERKAERDTDDLIERFHRVLGILERWGYLDGWRLTGKGRRLRFVYNELDLVLSEAIGAGSLSGLDPAQLAAVASLFTYERRSAGDEETAWPDRAVHERGEAIVDVWRRLAADEVDADLPVTREPDAGFTAVVYEWAAGAELEEIFGEAEFAAGDFVRNCRQLLDLLRQLRDGFPAIAATAAEAVRAVDRGVVAAGGAV